MLAGLASFAVFMLTTDPGPESLSPANPLAFFFIIPIQIFVWAQTGQVAANLVAVGALQVSFAAAGSIAYALDDRRKR